MTAFPVADGSEYLHRMPCESLPREYISQSVMPNVQASVLLLYVTVLDSEKLSSVSGAIHLNGSDVFQRTVHISRVNELTHT